MSAEAKDVEIHGGSEEWEYESSYTGYSSGDEESSSDESDDD